jgi:hypothetical protein
MTTHPLPAEQFPLSVHFDVLRRFMSASRNGVEPVTPVSVEGGDLPAGAAQLNVGFLSDVGMLIEEAPGKFKPTPVAMQFINTKLSDEDRGRRLLRSVVAKLWFGRATAAFLQANPNGTGAELTSALAAEAQLPTAEGAGRIAVLVEYLTYTGLVALPVSTSVPPVVAPSSNGRAGPKPRRRAAAGAGESSGWRVLRTDDFDLKVRSDPEAVRRLRKHLDLLEEELEHGAERRGSP